MQVNNTVLQYGTRSTTAKSLSSGIGKDVEKTAAAATCGQVNSMQIFSSRTTHKIHTRKACVQLHTSADNTTLLAFAAVRRAAAVHDGRRC